MKNWKKIILITIVLVNLSIGFAQQNHFQRIELFYSQENYKKTYKYAGKLINNPLLDEFVQPIFFRALSAFHLAEDNRWIKKHPNTFQEAINLYDEFLNSHAKDQNVEENLLKHVENLQKYLQQQIKQLENEQKNEQAQQIKQFLYRIGVEPNIEKLTENINKNAETTLRDELIKFANQQLNAPYSYGGSSPKGFDCSGFVSYVFETYNIVLPRRSEEQYFKAQKIEKHKIEKGDLIFFDSGKGVNHVGIVVSKMPLIMIHASTSKGVVITDVENSSYWKQRIKGYGRVL